MLAICNFNCCVIRNVTRFSWHLLIVRSDDSNSGYEDAVGAITRIDRYQSSEMSKPLGLLVRSAVNDLFWDLSRTISLMRVRTSYDEETSDEALLSGVAVGDDRAVLAFVRRYQRRLFGLALGIVGDPGMAEDVAQEAFIRILRHAAVYDARRGSVATWTLTITRNLAIDAVRVRRPIPTAPEDRVFLSLVSDERSPDDAAVMSDSVTPGARRARRHCRSTNVERSCWP